MPSYHAPLRDMQFLLQELWPMDKAYASLAAFAEFDKETIDAILQEAAKFCENELFPLNQAGDLEGCQFADGKVTTPVGLQRAYAQFVAAGWPALVGEPTWGGQGLPHVVGACIDEMLCASNVSFHLYPNLTQGVARAIRAHASDDLQQQYLPKLISGQWTGAMCLTEAHCGTDLGLLRTKAEPQADGSYRISGTKIFITGGEHDLAENIIHLVLARTPNAPEGVKGISLFLVPKIKLMADGMLAGDNGIRCGSIEHKMGIKASATCVINYEQATGYLVGELNKGMRAMFTVMNIERLAIGIQGLGLTEVSYQNALAYAKERLQGRAKDQRIYPDKPADPLLVHADIRRMLLQMKTFIEAARALAVWVYQQTDLAAHHPDLKQKQLAQAMVDLFTPVVKAYFTDQGFIQCNHGMQVLGGHGYITEWGMEQYVRDARIAQIYEGANGIQALDLVERKVLADQGVAIYAWLTEVNNFVQAMQSDSQYQQTVASFAMGLQSLQTATQWLLATAGQDNQAGAAVATDYLSLFGCVALGYMWLRMYYVAKPKAHNDLFYHSKCQSAEFYFAKVLPVTQGLLHSITQGSAVVMQMPAAAF